jgi:hypothetical protein
VPHPSVFFVFSVKAVGRPLGYVSVGGVVGEGFTVMSKKVCPRITRINANEGGLFGMCRIRPWFLRFPRFPLRP